MWVGRGFDHVHEVLPPEVVVPLASAEWYHAVLLLPVIAVAVAVAVVVAVVVDVDVAVAVGLV